MAVISLIGAVQTLFYLILFNSKKKKVLSDYVLLLFLLLLLAILIVSGVRAIQILIGGCNTEHAGQRVTAQVCDRAGYLLNRAFLA